jgi:protein-disulfide isomerase
MQPICNPAVAYAMLALSSLLLGAETGPPKLDKAKLETYLRYAEGYPSTVKVVIDDPASSPYKGYYRVLVHLSRNSSKLDRVYYIAPDGEHFINGTIWDLHESPFLDTLEHLPKDGFSFGPANAKVTIVIFSDFECPYCRELAETVRGNIPQKYPNDVRVMFKDFPIESMHKWARAAAEAGQCLGEQKPEVFWAFHDWMFEHQGEVNESNVREKALAIAKERNLDLARASSCIDTHAAAKAVSDSLKAGQALQIQQTPTSFVNGRTISGAVAWPVLDTVIQLELNRSKDIPRPPAEKCCEIIVPAAIKE